MICIHLLSRNMATCRSPIEGSLRTSLETDCTVWLLPRLYSAAFVGSCVIISLLASHNHAPPSKDLKAIRGLVNAALEEGFKLV